MVTAVESNLALQDFAPGAWRPPIIKTEATTGRGVAELWAAIQAYRAQAEQGQHARRRTRSEFRLRELLTHRFLQHVEAQVLAAGELEATAERIAQRELDPYSAAAAIFARALGGGAPARTSREQKERPD